VQSVAISIASVFISAGLRALSISMQLRASQESYPGARKAAILAMPLRLLLLLLLLLPPPPLLRGMPKLATPSMKGLLPVHIKRSAARSRYRGSLLSLVSLMSFVRLHLGCRR
jgi:hypothetical protein